MKPTTRKRGSPAPEEGQCVFSNEWDTGGGPGFNGSTEIRKDGDRFSVIVRNKAITPAEESFGPYSTFDEALADERTAAKYVGAGTVRVDCSLLTLAELLPRLCVYLPEEEEATSWIVTINGRSVRVAAEGFTPTT